MCRGFSWPREKRKALDVSHSRRDIFRLYALGSPEMMARKSRGGAGRWANGQSCTNEERGTSRTEKKSDSQIQLFHR